MHRRALVLISVGKSFLGTCEAFAFLIVKLQQSGGKFCDGCEEEVGFGGAKTLFCGKRAEDGDGCMDAGAAGHLQIFWRVAYEDGVGRTEVHEAKGETQRGRMRFAEAGIAAADAGGKAIPEFEFAQLAMNTVAVTAGDESQSVMARQLSEDPARAWEEFWTMAGVVLEPDLIGSVPSRAGKIRGAIDVVPVGRIVLLEFCYAPGDLHLFKHGQVGGGIGGVGVEERAVPVEEDALESTIAGCFH
jgi:hypothetical protein